MMSSTQPHPRRRPALICLLVLMASFTWVRAAAVYLVAQADPSHTAGVSLRGGGSGGGRLAVVLSHGAEACGSVRMSATHQHGAAARVLTLLASAPSAKSDHVVSVGGGSDFATLEGPRLLVRPVDLLPGASFPRGTDPCHDFCWRVPAHEPRPPPVLNARLEAVRVMVLLV